MYPPMQFRLLRRRLRVRAFLSQTIKLSWKMPEFLTTNKADACRENWGYGSAEARGLT
jgi:hypothetical protein